MVAGYSGPLSCDFAPDLDTAWRFLQWWFEFCTAGVIEVGWQHPPSGGLTLFRRFEIGDIGILKCIAEENRVPGQSSYVRAATIDPAAPIGRTLDMHVMQAPGAWGDLDTAQQVALAKAVGGAVRVNGWTRTGAHPHERYQIWLRLEAPLTGVELIRSTNRRLHKLYGGDPVVCNPSRLMRLPGTIAWPYKEGRIVELTSFETAGADRPASYPVATVTASLPQLDEVTAEDWGPVGEVTEERMVNLAATDAAINPVAGLIADIVSKRTPWHNGMIRLVAHWVGRGWSNAEILLAAQGLTLQGWTPMQTREEAYKAIEGARRKWGVPERVVSEVSVPASTVDLLVDPDRDAMESVRRRQWVYGHFLTRGFISVLGAPGGYGKTAYAKAIVLALVTGVALLEETVHEPVRVAYWNLEDPFDEMLRRLWAAMLHFGVSWSEVESRLPMRSGRDRELIIARRNESGAIITPDADGIVAVLKEKKIGAVVVDPFVRSHRLVENSNEEMDVVVATWARIATEANVAVLLVHHFNKGGHGGDADAFRGASAVINAARAAISLSRMTELEAEKLGVPNWERWRYLRADNAKLNTAPPPQAAVWLRLVSVALPNGPLGGEGDNVQTVERWYPRSPWADFPMNDVVACLTAIDAGSEGEFYTATRQGKVANRWAGDVVHQHIKREIDDQQAQGIINQWLQSGLLVVTDYYSTGKQYKTRKGVRVDRAKLSEMQASGFTQNGG